MRFQDKIVLITGGAIGFGRAFARAFAAEGASIVIAEIDDEQAEQTASELRETDARAIAVHCDVSDEQEVDDAVAVAVGELGGVDILFNNAALHLSKYNQPFGMLPRDEIRRLFDVNVVGIVNCTLACRESMSARGGGAVVNLSSSAADLSMSPYGVSKLAVRGLTVAFAQELAPEGIRVNAIAPGFMATENAIADIPQHLVDKVVNEFQMVHRLGSMDDIVAAALYLASDDAGFVTGQTLNVNGGYPLRV
jgi:NAD(P)-dependent dehydrogenase (short-subunit alcohol dehydrogenase family)